MRNVIFLLLSLIIAAVTIGTTSATAGEQRYTYTKDYRTHAHRQDVRRVYRHETRFERRHDYRHAARHDYRRAARYDYRRVSHLHRPMVRYFTRGPALSQAVHYYDGTLVGRDPDANIRLMLLKDNARTLWAR